MKLSVTAAPYILGNVPILFQGDLEGAMRAACDLHMDGVELHLRQPSDIDRQQVRAWCSRYQLQVPAIGTGWSAILEGLTFTHPDASVRRAAVQRICEHLELAAYLDSAVILGLILGSLGKGEPGRSNNRLVLLDCLSECAHFAENLGVDIFIEPINRYESDHLNTLQDAVALLNDAGSPPRLKPLADSFHMNIEEKDIASAIQRCPPAHVHLADSNRRAPGYGHLDFRPILQSLRDAHYAGYLSFEMLAFPEPAQAAGAGANHIRSIIQTLSDIPA